MPRRAPCASRELEQGAVPSPRASSQRVSRRCEAAASHLVACTGARAAIVWSARSERAKVLPFGRVVCLVACGKRDGWLTHGHDGCAAVLATGEQQRGKQVHLDHLGRGVQGESRDSSAFWIASRDGAGPRRRGVAAHHPRRRDSGAPPLPRPSAPHPLVPLLPAHLAHIAI